MSIIFSTFNHSYITCKQLQTLLLPKAISHLYSLISTSGLIVVIEVFAMLKWDIINGILIQCVGQINENL